MKKPTLPSAMLSRGELATLAGCNIETIRYYEQIRLLPAPARTQGGHRLYGEDLVKRLTFVRRSRELGFTLEEIRGLLGLVDGGQFTCGQVEALTREHAREIRRKIADLRKLKNALESMAARCSGGRVPKCPIIEVLFDTRVPLPLRTASSRSKEMSLRRQLNR